MDGLTQTWPLPKGLPSLAGNGIGADRQTSVQSLIPLGLLCPGLSTVPVTARNEVDRVPFMTRAEAAVDSDGRMNHQEAGPGPGEAGQERRGCPGLAQSLCRARAHSGSSALGRKSCEGRGLWFWHLGGRSGWAGRVDRLWPKGAAHFPPHLGALRVPVCSHCPI